MENIENAEFRKGGRGRWARRHRPGADFGPGGVPFRHGGPPGFGPGFGPQFGPGFGPGFGGPGFGPGFGRGRGRGGRGRRGDVRAAILLLLTERPMHGYELIQRIRERSDDLWRPSPGSIYPALSQLEDEGLITIEKVAGRKTAQLTETGNAHVTEHRDELGDPWADVKEGVGEHASDLRALIPPLMGAVAQVAAAGTPDQAAKAAEVLTDARKALYRILAEDETPER
ncbi:PadR family transcriptional regulator [Nocardia sp. NPDC003345]